MNIVIIRNNMHFTIRHLLEINMDAEHTNSTTRITRVLSTQHSDISSLKALNDNNRFSPTCGV
jgi:hypothetical protein